MCFVARGLVTTPQLVGVLVLSLLRAHTHTCFFFFLCYFGVCKRFIHRGRVGDGLRGIAWRGFDVNVSIANGFL